MNFFRGVVNKLGVFSAEGISVKIDKFHFALLKEKGYLGKEVIMSIRLG
ncbi:MAG: hypothetical protein ACQERX_05810 [Bacillota bacterium]